MVVATYESFITAVKIQKEIKILPKDPLIRERGKKVPGGKLRGIM
jgi:hypothetical protein